MLALDVKNKHLVSLGKEEEKQLTRRNRYSEKNASAPKMKLEPGQFGGGTLGGGGGRKKKLFSAKEGLRISTTISSHSKKQEDAS